MSQRISIWPLLLGAAVATSCGTSITDPDDVVINDVRYRVTNLVVAESFPVQIGVTVEVENLASSVRSVVFPDGCVVLRRAYRSASSPAWDEGFVTACTLAIVEVDLTPGERRLFDTGLVSAATILGDSLPNGEYRITAYLRPGETVELDAGLVDLVVP